MSKSLLRTAKPSIAELSCAGTDKGDTIKFLKDKRGNSTALDLVDPKEAYEITKVEWL